MRIFDGWTAVVTGASRGVGRRLAIDLAGAGASVVVNFLGSEDAAADVVDLIRARGGNAFHYRADISCADEVEAMLAATMEAYGRVDILINAAGVRMDGPFLDLTESDWDRVIDTNLKGVFLCSQVFGRAMRIAGHGQIVNISDVNGIDARRDGANYCASKAGLNMLTRCIALELAPDVRVNGLALGLFQSDLIAGTCAPEKIARVVDETPLGRAGTFGEVTDAVVFMVSDSAGFVTGQTLIIDGGRNLG
jgi:3-oxoacyl-[acyl-carrier protein] reductase